MLDLIDATGDRVVAKPAAALDLKIEIDSSAVTHFAESSCASQANARAPVGGIHFLFRDTQIHLFAVVDGIGRPAVSRLAAGVVVQALAEFVQRDSLRTSTSLSGGNVFAQLQDCLVACQKRLREKAATMDDAYDLGTTITLACVEWPRLILLHIGDSRCYLYRNFRLEQITTDHTIAERMIGAGVLARDQAGSSPWANVLCNALTPSKSDVQTDVLECELRLGDSLLLCSGSLPRQVPERRIAELLREHGSADEACRKLMAASQMPDTRDDVTAVVVHCRNVSDPQRRSSEECIEQIPVDQVSTRGDSEGLVTPGTCVPSSAAAGG